MCTSTREKTRGERPNSSPRITTMVWGPSSNTHNAGELYIFIWYIMFEKEKKILVYFGGDIGGLTSNCWVQRIIWMGWTPPIHECTNYQGHRGYNWQNLHAWIEGEKLSKGWTTPMHECMNFQGHEDTNWPNIHARIEGKKLSKGSIFMIA